MDAIKILGAFASALNIDVAELTGKLKTGDAWNTDAAETIADVISSQFRAVKEAQFKRGVREKGKEFEKLLGKHGFQNPSKLEGEELVNEFVETLKGEATQKGADPAKMSKEELLKLPEVKSIFEEGKRTGAANFETLKAEFDREKASWQQQRVKDKAAAILPSLLEEANIVLDVKGVEGSKARRIAAISSMIDWNEVTVNDKGELIFVDQDGHPKTDDAGKPVDFKKTVVGIASGIYEVRTQDPNKGGANPAGNPTNPANPGGEKYTPSFNFNKDEKAFNAAMLNELDPGKRATMLKDWNLETAQQ
jgi:hypothetical protein